MRIIQALLNNVVTRNAALATFVLVLPLTASLMLASLGVPIKGFAWLEEEEAPVVQEEVKARTVVDFTATPANRAFDRVFRGLDKTWEGTSSPVDAAGLPQPLDCVAPAPALSEARTYNANNREVAVTLAAYPAGVGGEMYSRFLSETLTCKPSSFSIFTYPVSGLGVEAFTMDASWGANDVEITALRRGDVVAFTVTKNGGASATAAKVVDSYLRAALSRNVCVSQNSSVKDQRRNAFFSGRSFTGLQTEKEIRAKKVKDPRLTPDQKAAGVEKSSIPAEPLKTFPVKLPSSDFTYPLWPPLPTPVLAPSMPTVPEPQKLKDYALIREPDPLGPGCGWSFMTTIEPSFDEAQVEANNAELVGIAEEVLASDAARWKRDVRAYWTAYHEYLTVEIPAYRAYRSEVAEVSEAWDLIHAAWDAYYTAYANWEIEEAARLAFIEEKRAARTTYKEQLAACEAYPEEYANYEAAMKQYRADRRQYREDKAAYDEAYAKWEEDYAEWEESDNPNKGPAPEEPEKPIRPVEPEEPVLDHPCPPVPDPILEEKAPKATEAPKPPPDPRPASAR